MAKPPSEFVVSLLELIEPIGPVSWRRMFGGYGLYMEGVMMALVADDELYLKTDAQSQAEFARVDSEPFGYEKNGKTLQMSYWKAPEVVFDEPEDMLHWVQLAVAAALRQQR